MHNKVTWKSRLYKNEQDLLQMQDLLMEARARTDDWRYAHIGDLLFWFFMVSCHLDPQEHIRLWHEADRLVGYVILGEDPSFDWQVLPEYAWRGIEDEAMIWAETRIAELCQRDPKRWGGQCVSGARHEPCQRLDRSHEYPGDPAV